MSLFVGCPGGAGADLEILSPQKGAAPAKPSHTYNISFELHSRPTTIASVAFIKRPAPLELGTNLYLQLQVINLPGHVGLAGTQGTVSPYEILHAMVHSALAPYFDAYTKEQESQAVTRTNRFADAEAKTGELQWRVVVGYRG